MTEHYFKDGQRITKEENEAIIREKERKKEIERIQEESRVKKLKEIKNLTEFCSKCKTKMIEGFITQSRQDSLVTIFGGIYWTQHESGAAIVGRIGLKAFLCPNCGNIDLSVRDPDDLNKLNQTP